MKGEVSASLLFAYTILIVSFIAGIFLVVKSNIDVAAEFPETSSQLSSYSFLEEILSEECIGTETSGVINVSLLDNPPNCLSNPSLSNYILIVNKNTEEMWEYGEVLFGPTYDIAYRYVFPISIQNNNKVDPANITLVTSYSNKNLLLFLATCSEEAVRTDECRKIFRIADVNVRVDYSGNTICGAYEKCVSISSQFADDYTFVYGKSISEEIIGKGNDVVHITKNENGNLVVR